ncbi:uncharacterized protein BDR25DRAFT_395918 [Lindgomyces ingoldianus]|uniref:Uncharacterized protein n=1 Tax=Lindgomyces ingoldianus TaxID=673940 RepID=A0ACB6QGH2_9PLEO|nr:uncharacterized protein BDR25DRAFT_395918 [Lindgomyces ingoldianus]KAF2466109.1 hypothetical protein BDR25DRAFT_395918 [Lindgomyces ingoldianus]
MRSDLQPVPLWHTSTALDSCTSTPGWPYWSVWKDAPPQATIAINLHEQSRTYVHDPKLQRRHCFTDGKMFSATEKREMRNRLRLISRLHLISNGNQRDLAVNVATKQGGQPTRSGHIPCSAGCMEEKGRSRDAGCGPFCTTSKGDDSLEICFKLLRGRDSRYYGRNNVTVQGASDLFRHTGVSATCLNKGSVSRGTELGSAKQRGVDIPAAGRITVTTIWFLYEGTYMGPSHDRDIAD